MTKEEIQKNSEHWYNKYKDAEKRITELENKIADIKANCDLAIEGRDVKIKELEKENAELRKNGFTVSAMTEQQLKVALGKGEQLEKENAELKAFRQDCVKLTEDNVVMARQRAEIARQLTKAKEIIKDLLRLPYANDWEVYGDVTSYLDKAEQFLKEIEK